MQPSLRKTFKNLIAKRLFGYGPVDDYSQVDQFQGPAKDIKLLGMYSGIAYRCISTIAEAMAGQYEPYPYITNSDGQETTISTHPLWDTLNDPNPDLTFYQLIEGSSTFIEQFGEFFWYVVPGSLSGYKGGIKEIYLLRPDRMGIKIDKNNGEVIGYNYSVASGTKKVPFTPEEIRHFKTLNPRNAYRGYAPLEAAIEYVVTEKEVSRFTTNYFANNAQLSGILEVSGKVSRESWNKFVRQWRDRYGGVDNAGKVALIRDSQVKWTPVTSNIGDMQLDQLKQTTIEQILMMFRIPKGLFGMESGEGLGRASVETLEYIFAKWCIDNKLDRFDDFLESISQDYYGGIKCEVGHKNIIPSDKEFELKAYTAGVDKWVTRKEIRDKDPELKNNVIEGSDELFVLNNQLPIGDPMSSEQAASKPPMVAPNNGPASGGDDTMNDDNMDMGDDDMDGDMADGKSLKIVLSRPKKKELEYAQKEAFRQSLEQNYEKYIGKYRAAFNKVIATQKETVLSNIQHLASTSKDLTDTLLNMSEEDQNFQDEVMPVLSGLMLEQGQLALEFSNGSGQYQLSQSLKNAVAKSTKKMSQNFDSQTLDELNASLSEGLQNGDGIDELSARVSAVYDSASSWRADRVARTEAQSASSSATLDAYQQNPVVTSMQWFAQPDACEFCDELDGTIVGLEETFVNQGDSVDVSQSDGSTDSYQADYGNVETPPLHPNCSCVIIPVTEAN